VQGQKNDEGCPRDIFQRQGRRAAPSNDWNLREVRYQNVQDFAEFAEKVILFLRAKTKLSRKLAGQFCL